MDEQYYFEQFGVEDNRKTEEEDPGTVAEEPEEQEVAQPAEDEGAGKPKQSKRENAKYAAARREAERERDDALQDVEARIAQAREEAAKQAQEELLKEQGIENPYTNEMITSIEQYNQYKQMHAQKQHEQRLRDLDMDEDQYNQMVNDLPEVRQAREITESTRQAEMKAQVEAEIKQISQMNPSIQSVEDLVKDDKYDEIFKRIQTSNISLYDAYRLTHFDDISRRTGRQQAINQAGKSHMTSTVARGEGSVNVPGDVMSMFRQMVPNASDEQIAKFYNKQIQNE